MEAKKNWIWYVATLSKFHARRPCRRTTTTCKSFCHSRSFTQSTWDLQSGIARAWTILFRKTSDRIRPVLASKAKKTRWCGKQKWMCARFLMSNASSPKCPWCSPKLWRKISGLTRRGRSSARWAATALQRADRVAAIFSNWINIFCRRLPITCLVAYLHAPPLCPLGRTRTKCKIKWVKYGLKTWYSEV